MSRSTLITPAQASQPNGVAGLDGNSGLVVPGYAEIAQIAAPAAPAAGKTRLYVDSNGLLQLLPATGGGRRVVAHWGSGTVFPTGIAAGDTYLRSDIGTVGTLFTYQGGSIGLSGWVPEGNAVTCTSTTRPSAAQSFAGMTAYETDTGNNLQYSSAGWGYLPGGPVPWTWVTYQNGYASVAGYQPAAYRKIGDRVELRGIANGAYTATVVMFTLPVGFRPTTREVFSYTQDAASYGRFDVRADGTVTREAQANAITGGYVSFSGVSFSTAA